MFSQSLRRKFTTSVNPNHPRPTFPMPGYVAGPPPPEVRRKNVITFAALLGLVASTFWFSKQAIMSAPDAMNAQEVAKMEREIAREEARASR